MIALSWWRSTSRGRPSMTDAELVQFVLDEAADLFEVIRKLNRPPYPPNLRPHRPREYEPTPNRRTHANERRYRLNERLREEATRHYSEWTGPELELAGRE